MTSCYSKRIRVVVALTMSIRADVSSVEHCGSGVVDGVYRCRRHHFATAPGGSNGRRMLSPMPPPPLPTEKAAVVVALIEGCKDGKYC